MVLWVGPKAERADSPHILAVVNGSLICGQVAGADDGLLIGDVEAIGITSVVTVDACP